MKKCLLIIDVQEGFINQHTRDIPGRVAELQPGYDLVFVSRFVNRLHSPYRKFLDWHKFDVHSPETALAFDPQPHAVVFDKAVYSCIGGFLLMHLAEHNVTEVHLCGIDTDCCVLKTAVDLFELGYRPLVLSSACASHAGREYHEAGLTLLHRLIGRKQIK